MDVQKLAVFTQRNISQISAEYWIGSGIYKITDIGRLVFTILQTVYRLKECPQVPARIFFVQTGQNWDPPGVHRSPTGGVEGVRNVRLMGLFDARGRLMAVATHNTDIADGWEREGESKEFFDRFSVHSYAMAINVLFYAMTH